MKAYILRRIAHAIFIMWMVATVVFFGMRFIPGGPVAAMLGQSPTQAQINALRRELGLNKPIYIQYIEWFVDLLRFDLGTSLSSGQPVTEIILLAAPKTASIGVLAILIGLAIAIPAGIISATQKHKLPDHIATVVAFLGISMPPFFIGILLAVVFGVWLDLLPVFSYTPLSEGVVPWFKSILLPGFAVGLPYSAIVMRMMRSSLLEVLGEQYMETVRAKGLPSNIRLYKHALQNALIPVVTVAGIQLAVIIGGSVTVEIVFGIKGMGRVIVQSIINRDYPVTQGAIITLAGILVLINLVVDITYTVIDPRIRYSEDH